MYLVFIEGMLIRVGVRSDAHALGGDDDWGTVLYCILSGGGHCIHRVEDVLPVTEECLEVSYASIVLSYTGIGCLLVGGYGDPVAVAL